MDLILLVWLLLCGIPVLYLAIQILAATFLPEKDNSLKETKPQIGVLIPAHNEELVIADTLSQLNKQLSYNDCLLVVADNCTDKTAELSQSFGATVIERDEPSLRGKGFALEFGIDYLRKIKPDVVIIIDADCKVHPGTINLLARMATQRNCPIQAKYLMFPKTDSDLAQYVSAFAILLKNFVRLLGLKKLGLPSPLTGSGMAFPWEIINRNLLDKTSIVEDMLLGITCISHNITPQFCPDAYVSSYLPQTNLENQKQRLRWEHGHLHTILSSCPKLFFSGIKRKNLKSILYSLDISIPPLTLMLYILTINFVFSLFFIFISDSYYLSIISFSTIIIFISAISLAWFNFGKKFFPETELKAIPKYLLNKCSIYIKFIFDRQNDWTKTNRE